MISTDPTLISGWKITVPAYKYLLYCAIASLLVRAFLCLFKAADLGKVENGRRHKGKRFWRRYWSTFNGFAVPENLKDYWLTAVIGFSEAAAYPVLIFLNHSTIIGGWLVIKTAGQWTVWKDSRATFNRFLVGNLLMFGMCYFWLLGYVSS